MQRIQDFQLGGPEKLIGADDPRDALQENGGLADQWCLDDGDILCHPLRVLPYLQAFDAANVKSGAERNKKTEVICYVQTISFCFCGSAWKRPTWSCSGTPPVCCKSNSWQTQMSSAPCMNVCSCVRIHRQFALFRESLGVSRIIHILRAHGHAVHQDKGCCPPSTPGGPHCSQTAGSWHDSRCSNRRTRTRAAFAGATGHLHRIGHRRLSQDPETTAGLYL